MDESSARPEARSGRQGEGVTGRMRTVERTFGWITRWRRLVSDFEGRIDVSEVMIRIAMGGLLLRRITHESMFSNGIFDLKVSVAAH